MIDKAPSTDVLSIEAEKSKVINILTPVAELAPMA
jgi:hypothetical protein